MSITDEKSQQQESVTDTARQTMIRLGPDKKGILEVEGTTWTIYYKAIFGVGGLSRTRTITFAASSSPDSGSLAT